MECPRCKNKEKQVWNGKNKSGSQSWLCGECGRRHTPKPNINGYPEIDRQWAIRALLSGTSGREIGELYEFNKANVYNWYRKMKNSTSSCENPKENE